MDEPNNNVLSLVQASRHPFDFASTASAESMLTELLILHEQMVAQLRLQRLSTVGTTEFLRGMIEQHERAVGMLRAQLEQRQATPPPPAF